MIEAEWLSATDPQPMLDFLWGKISKRKLRLFTCACCSRVWRWLRDPRSKEAIKVLGRFADGRASQADLHNAYQSASDVLDDIHEQACEQRLYYVEEYAAQAAVAACSLDVDAGIVLETARLTRDAIVLAEEGDEKAFRRRVMAAQADCLRDIVGNPFQTVRISAFLLSANDEMVIRLAQSIYHDCAFVCGERAVEQFFRLADALEDVGCTDPAILDHLREPRRHVRGCHVIDLLLGRS